MLGRSAGDGPPGGRYPLGAFLEYPSTSSNILILQALMRLTKKSKRPLFAVSLDLRKAFAAVSHEAIFAALEARKVPLRTQSLVREMYTNASSVFWSGGGF